MCPKCLMGAALETPTLPPSEPNTGAAFGADEATLPPDGEIRDAPPNAAYFRIFQQKRLDRHRFC
jgi:hypothetical protein